MDDPTALAQSRVQRMNRPILAARPFKSVDVPDWVGRALAGDILDEVVRRGGFRALSRHTTFRGDHTSADLIATGAGVSIAGACSGSKLSVHLSKPDKQIVKLDVPLPGLHSLQTTADTAADWVIQQLGGALPMPEPERPLVRDESEPEAHKSLLEALEHLWEFTSEGNTFALEIATQSAEQYPDHAPTQALRAMLLTRAYRSGWRTDRDYILKEVEHALSTAYGNWTGEPLLYWASAFAEAMLLRRYPLAAQLTRRSVDLQPHNSPALTWGALFLCYDIEFDAAEALARQALHWSRDDPMRITQGFAGALAAIHAGRDQAALEFCDLVLASNPSMINVLRIRAAALFNMGNQAAATEVMQIILAIDPAESQALIEKVNPLREWSGFARYLAALDGAGMPRGEQN